MSYIRSMKDYKKIKSIKIGPLTYKVKFKDLKEEKVFGYHEINSKETVICIDKNIKGELLENVLIHEITHAMLYQMGSKKSNDEVFVQSLSNLIQQVFKLK